MRRKRRTTRTVVIPDHDTMLENIKRAYLQFKDDGFVYWCGKIIENEWLFIDMLIHHDIISKIVTPEEIWAIPIEYAKHLEKHKKTPYQITDDDIDLLIEIENVLMKRSRQIWGLTHKKKIKGGADITPYETGYDRMYDFIELISRLG